LSSPKVDRKLNGNATYISAKQLAQTSVKMPLDLPVKSQPQDQVAVNVEIHEKHVIEKVEIASVAYMIIFGKVEI
jgi:hypothetical protein